MKMTLTEAMKLIKELDREKDDLIAFEDRNCYCSFKENETKVPTGYDYGATRKRVDEIDAEVLKIRFALARANTAIALEGFDMTVAEGLVWIAQLQEKRRQLETLAGAIQLTRRITPNGILEYTERLYDVGAAKSQAAETVRTIHALQVAIDRANLLNFIEI